MTDTLAMQLEAEAERRARRQAAWRVDPVAFAVEALGLTMWSRFRDLLCAAASHDRLACRSGHKVSKSSALAALALWWFWRGGQVLATGPTATVVQEVWWGELRRLALGARVTLPTPAMKSSTGMTASDGRRLYGYSTDAAERIAIRGERWLFLVDEASGVDEDIFTAIEGQAAGGARIVMVGNPTQPTGVFADAFGRDRGSWHTLHISSEQSPNVTGEVEIPGLATRDWIEKCKKRWGESSPLYQVRVGGQFADASECCVIPLGDVQRAIDRWDASVVRRALEDANFAAQLGELQIGTDVARFGDDYSVSVARRGNYVLDIVDRNGFAEHQVAGLVLDQVRRLRHPRELPVRVKVDTTGGSGAGTASVLRQSPDVQVIEVNAGDTANAPDEFVNRRSELWYATKSWIDEGGCIPNHDQLAADLVAPHYGFDERGRRVVEKKKEFKRRLKRSPDWADALALSVYKIAPRRSDETQARDPHERELLEARARRRAENTGYSDSDWRSDS